GSVTLRLGGSYIDDGYELSIIVKDTGKGIRKEDQENLFDAFSRADIKANANIEGTGLGLAIVKSIVESMKGSLGVESEYGAGSEFWVNLPVKYNSKDALTDDFMKADHGYDEILEECDFTAPDAKVLAVDDNKSNLTIVKLFLKRTGIKPDLCSSGTQAIELCKEKKYDLLLLDHMMPQPDGIETLHIIREDKDSLNKDTKAVVLTANAVAGSRQKYIDEGFDDYLTKPLDSKLLEQTVKNMLPEEKVLEVPEPSEDRTNKSDSEKDFAMSPVKKRLTAIAGLNYEAALRHCAEDEDLLEEIVSDVAAECGERSERMKKNLEAKDLKAYEIDAHTIKSTMATLGLKELSERAKKHEFAAKEKDMDFISGDAEGFIDAYVEVCRKLEP
ncbi:MAG: response regulator, partial [Eubacterium sp.]|nr:response regulator [Eubacterium sp.]